MNRHKRLILLALACAVIPAAIPAQEPGAKPETSAPAQPAAPKLTASGHPDNEYWREHDRQMLFDFPWLARYKDADAKLGPPAADESRVVFMGDSITEGWHLDQSFPGKPY